MKKIISERWVWIQQQGAQNPFVQSGTFISPTIQYNAARLSASGVCELENTAAEIHNAFHIADAVLIRRFRIWSPICALGLCGSHTNDAGADFRIYAAQAGTTTGKIIVAKNGLAFGEWVDVNQMIDAKGLPDSEYWQLAPHLEYSLELDSSRVSSGLIGNAFLKFQIQVDLAHTLPGLKVNV